MQNQTIEVVHGSSVATYENHTDTADRAGMRACVRQWLVTNIAAVLEIAPTSIDVNRDLDELGMDSLQAVCLSGDMETWLGLEISETAMWDYPTIESMCDYVMRKIPVAA